MNTKKSMSVFLLVAACILLGIVPTTHAQQILSATAHGDTDMVEAILNSDPTQIENHDSQLATPLHVAGTIASPELVALLLERGADPNSADLRGRTPLHNAAINGDINVIQIMMRSSADPSLPDASGLTPWDIAIQKGHLRAAQLMSRLAIGTAQNEQLAKDHDLPTPKTQLLVAVTLAQ